MSRVKPPHIARYYWQVILWGSFGLLIRRFVHLPIVWAQISIVSQYSLKEYQILWYIVLNYSLEKWWELMKKSLFQSLTHGISKRMTTVNLALQNESGGGSGWSGKKLDRFRIPTTNTFKRPYPKLRSKFAALFHNASKSLFMPLWTEI